MAEAGQNGRSEAQSAVDAAGITPAYLNALLHELRNPLAPIRNAAELLRTLCSDPRQLQAIDILSRQIVHLTRAMDDLSDAVNARRSQMQLRKRTVDLVAFIEPALHAIRADVDAQRQNLFVSLPSEPVRMHCDPTRLAQVVRTLLDNATSHTPAGGSIALKVFLTNDQLVIEVSDDGAGIAPERLPSMFNMFAQKPPSGGESSGLNLAIARNIIEMHGGTIDAASEGVGRGSRFTIRLPLVADAEQANVPAPSFGVTARRILVIDDHEDSAASLTQALATAGHSVLAAYTGEQGIALAESFRPEAVIIDIGLPGMDGFEVGRRLRASHATAGALLIAVTGYSMKQFRDLAAYSVFRHYLLKPTSPVVLLQVIERTLADAQR